MPFQFAKGFIPSTYMKEDESHHLPEKQFPTINILLYQNFDEKNIKSEVTTKFHYVINIYFLQKRNDPSFEHTWL